MQTEYDDLLEKKKQLESLEKQVAAAEAEARQEATKCREFEETHHAYTAQVVRTRELKKEHADLTERMTHATESALTADGLPADTKAVLIQQAELLVDQHDMLTAALKASERRERDIHQELMKLRLRATQEACQRSSGSEEPDVTITTKTNDETAKKLLAEEALQHAQKEEEKNQVRAKLEAAAQAVEQAQKKQKEEALKKEAEEKERQKKLLAEEMALKKAKEDAAKRLLEEEALKKAAEAKEQQERLLALKKATEDAAKKLQEEEALKRAAEEKERRDKLLAEEIALKKATEDAAKKLLEEEARKKAAEAKEQQERLLALKKATEDAAKKLQEEALKKEAEEKERQQKLLAEGMALKTANEDLNKSPEQGQDEFLKALMEEERKIHESDDATMKQQAELLRKANIQRDLKLQELAAQKRLEKENEKDRYRKECAGHKPEEDDMTTKLMHTMKISRSDAEGLVALQKLQKQTQQPVTKEPTAPPAEIPEEIKAEIDEENAKRKAEILDLENKMAKARKHLEILRQSEAEYRLRSGAMPLEEKTATEKTEDDAKEEDEKTKGTSAESRPLAHMHVNNEMQM